MCFENGITLPGSIAVLLKKIIIFQKSEKKPKKIKCSTVRLFIKKAGHQVLNLRRRASFIGMS
jgi:hypothetical protein